MYSGWFTSKTLQNTKGENWSLPDLLLSSPVVVKGNPDEYFVRDGGKCSAETLKYPLQLEEKRPLRYVKARGEEIFSIKENISIDDQVDFALKEKEKYTTEFNSFVGLKLLEDDGIIDQIIIDIPDQKNDINFNDVQDRQPNNVQGGIPMREDDELKKLPEVVDFEPISKKKAGIFVTIATLFGGLLGWSAGSSTAALIASLTPIAEAAIAAASAADATIATIFAAAQAASSTTGVSVLGSMAGAAMTGAEAGVVVGTGVQSSSLIGSIMLKISALSCRN